MALIDRGWGKPKEAIEATHRVTIEDLVMAAMRVEEEDRKRADAANGTVAISKPN